MQPKILITDKMHESLVPMLQELGYQVDNEPKITREEIINKLPDYMGIVVRSKTEIDKSLMSAGKNLKFIARAGAGVDQIDIEYTQEKGIHVLNAPEGNRDAVAEHVVGLILNLTNKIRQGDGQVRNKIWDREGNRGIELMSRTVGIIGYGFMGTAVSKRLSSFGCKVIAYDKYKTGFSDEYVQEVGPEDIFRETDILSFHVPLTEETRLYVNDAFLEQFKKPIILINTSRGEILPLKSLVKFLKNGKIISAGLDVLENEKFKKLTPVQEAMLDELFTMDNVLFTPHVAGWTVESYIKINETLAHKIKALKLV